MRIRISHATRYTYAFPAAGVVQALRLRPMDHDAQSVLRWRVDADADGTMRSARDAFGNVVQMFYADGPVGALTITAAGEVDVADSAGVIRGAIEPLPPAVFLRPTPLTAPDAAIVELAEGQRRATPLDTLHALAGAIYGAMRFEVASTGTTTTAAQAWAGGQGVCQDYAHLFAAAARHLGFPARYVSGHLAREPHHADQAAAHAWAEALVPDLGWVAFDAANGVCATDAYVRVAVGLDYLDAAPLRGARRGGGGETMTVEVRAIEEQRQWQRQSQGGQSQSQS